MPNHDIIDNRNEKLVDQILAILPQANGAHFAVGYFFLSGLEAIEDRLDSLDELRLLIGNTSNRETIEQLAEGYRRLELAESALDDVRFARRADRAQWAEETAVNVRDTVALMDQTDAGEELVHTLVRMIEQERLKVRIYTRGRLHSKAYIFDFANPNPGNEGLAIVGSSNLTLSGLTHNTELNVLVHDTGSPGHPGSGNHARLLQWFDELWQEAEEFAPWLMQELKQSWAARPVRPYDVYMKTLYTLVRDRIEGGEEREILWDDEITRTLTDFQKEAVRQAVQMIRDNGGCFVSDVVGLGKSYIGAAIVKHFERVEQVRPLIICPKPLEEMWIGYNERYHLNAHVLPMSMLQSGDRGVDLLDDVRYRDRDFVLVDESHNFRRHSSQRYQELQTFTAAGAGRKVCLLTATPRANQATDIYNQIKLFHPDDVTALPIDPPHLRQFFNAVARGEKQLQELLPHVLIRRTRRHILRWFGYAEDTDRPMRELSAEEAGDYLDGDKRAYILVGGQRRFFPRRELETLRYSIEATYNDLYHTLRGYLGRPGGMAATLRPGEALTYARYGLWRYVKRPKQDVAPYTDLKRAGINLRGLIRTMLFKRFESSVHAFRKTLTRMITTQEMFLKSLDEGFVPAGEKAEDLLGRGNVMDEADLLDALAQVSGRYNLADFHADLLRRHIAADLDLLRTMLGLVTPVTQDEDAKLQRFLGRIGEPDLAGKKLLVFTQYADTAQYLYDALDPDDSRPDVDVIYGADKSKSRIVGRFAPHANPEFAARPEIRLLVTTDVLAEGLNLQDGNIVINYDLHWNPVRLIQRLGRVDRIGSEHDSIHAFNFLPETELEKNLGLQEVLGRRIQEIHDTIGEDAAILDESEHINEDAMYAIYEGRAGGELDQAADLEDEDVLDLSEAEEMFRSMMRDDPEEYRRIADLRDGIRSGQPSPAGDLYVFCEAGRYQQLFLVDGDGEIISRDITEILPVIRAPEDRPAPASLPDGYNQAVMEIKRLFSEEVERRRAQQTRSHRLSSAQRYVVRELRAVRAETDDEDQQAQIDELERAFSLTPTVAVRRELNWLRRNGLIGQPLVKRLTQIYHEHRLRDRANHINMRQERTAVPRIICSEALF